MGELLPNEAVAFELPTAKLNNTGDAVVLEDGSGNEIDRLIYSSSVLGKSWQKNSQFGVTFLDSPTKNLAPTLADPTPAPLSISIEPTPTNTPSLVPSLTPTPTNKISQIEIREVMTCPLDSEPEWVKLFNASDQTVWINNWVLQDAQANRIALNDTILPNTYKTINWSKSILNNQGDTLTLFDANGNQVVSVILPQCSAGQSHIFVGTTPIFTNQPTPDEPNISRLPTPDNIKQLTPKTSTSASLQNNRRLTAFIPTIVPFVLENNQGYQFVTPATSQIVQTSQVKPIPMAGAIISLSSLLLAVGFHNVIKQ